MGQQPLADGECGLGAGTPLRNRRGREGRQRPVCSGPTVTDEGIVQRFRATATLDTDDIDMSPYFAHIIIDPHLCWLQDWPLQREFSLDDAYFDQSRLVRAGQYQRTSPGSL
uniref:Spondin domain-containing protein n=1 Tax=Angiostrongylus cantonensis TaxID=6313 RepID=A0A0K0DFU0_ANGCA